MENLIGSQTKRKNVNIFDSDDYSLSIYVLCLFDQYFVEC